jgi:hypothetical protein
VSTERDIFGSPFDFHSILAIRRAEADEFYARRAPADLSGDAKHVQRQAFAGYLWSKQFCHFVHIAHAMNNRGPGNRTLGLNLRRS